MKAFVFVARFVLCLLVGLGMGVARSQDIRSMILVVPFSAGSAQDVFARMISEPLGQELRARVVVVNKPGAGGTVGAAFVAHAKPDGETLLMAASGHHLSGALYPNLSYHPVNSFRGAAFTGATEFVLVTSASFKTPDLASFVGRVQAQPLTFNFASAGNGSTTHVAMTTFLERAGLQMVHLPLKGTGEIITELLSGRVQAAMVSAFSMQAYKSDLRLKMLASTDTRRSDQVPDLATLHESGFPHYKWTVWSGLLAPAGTPIEVVHDINRAVARVFEDTSVQTKFQQMGLSIRPMAVAQFESMLRDDWRQVSAQQAHIKVSLD
jgi:tripartite-type tricarboxylate transporter receptor subunit TctC